MDPVDPVDPVDPMDPASSFFAEILLFLLLLGLRLVFVLLGALGNPKARDQRGARTAGRWAQQVGAQGRRCSGRHGRHGLGCSRADLE